MLVLLNSPLILPLPVKSTLRRMPSILDLPNSALALGLPPAVVGDNSGDRVALTLSRWTGKVDVLIGGGGGLEPREELPFEEPFEEPCLELGVPFLVPGRIKSSSGMLCAVLCATKIFNTLIASLPKPKKEKKYYELLANGLQNSTPNLRHRQHMFHRCRSHGSCMFLQSQRPGCPQHRRRLQ